MNSYTGNYFQKKIDPDLVYLQRKNLIPCLNNTIHFKIYPLKNSILLLSLFLVIALFPGCMKNKTCTPVPPSAEVAQIQAYAVSHGMNVSADPSGLYYEILSLGGGAAATINSKISITYVGQLLNGTEFDRQTTPNAAAWPLSGLIEGWQIGIPLIREGGHIRLLVPSSLGYGCQPYGSLPANSVLFFDIQLVDVQ